MSIKLSSLKRATCWGLGLSPLALQGAKGRPGQHVVTKHPAAWGSPPCRGTPASWAALLGAVVTSARVVTCGEGETWPTSRSINITVKRALTQSRWSLPELPVSVCGLLDSLRGQSRNVPPQPHLPFTPQYFWKATMDLAEKLHFPIPLWLGRLRRFQQELWRPPSALLLAAWDTLCSSSRSPPRMDAASRAQKTRSRQGHW